MARTTSRSPAKRNAELKFPVRIRVKVPGQGLGKTLAELHQRLEDAYGPHDRFIGSDGVPGQDAVAIYLPDLEAIKLLDGLGLELCLMDEMKLY